MPIKYIGRKTDFKGKTLWEIVANLKNFGVGRLVIRNRFDRYPEPSYIRILKVAAMPPASDPTQEDRKVTMLVEKTFRGMTWPEPVQLESASYKADYVLIHKDQESRYLRPVNSKPETIMPRTMNFPPLFKEMLLRRAKLNKISIDEPKMEIYYNTTGFKKYKIAKEGETPTTTFDIGLGTPATPSLYPHLNQPDKLSHKGSR